MYRAMIFKELYQTRKIILLALAVYAFMTTRFMNLEYLPWGNSGSGETIPFVDDLFIDNYTSISILFAIILGLVQTLGEENRGTYPFFLQRPASRGWLLGMKLSVGIVVLLVCAALPVLAYGLWAATPGNHASPFCWSMTSDTWLLWAGMPIFYLAAFLCGIRPGRWFGTRLLPLAATGVLVVAYLVFGNIAGFGARILVILLVDAMFLACIYLVARQRDY